MSWTVPPIPSALACVTAVLGCGAHADTRFIEFEDLFGPCAPHEIVAGPGQVAVDGVVLAGAAPEAWSVGSEFGVPMELGNPFVTDALLLPAQGHGVTIHFSKPVVQVELVTGLHVHSGGHACFEVLARGRVVGTFAAHPDDVTHVQVALSPPSVEVRIRWIDGSPAPLGLESMGYVVAVACFGDLDGDGSVDGADLGLLLAAWGGAGPADLDGSGVVDGADLGALLGEWGQWGGCT